VDLGSDDLERLDHALTSEGVICAIKWLVDVHGSSISEAHLFVVDRAHAIGYTLDPPEPDIADLRSKIAALGAPPLAIEAIWDGDSRGWLVLLLAIARSEAGELTELQLGQFRDPTGDMRIFNGQVPPWPEAERATSVGQALAEELHVPFHFASPDAPGTDGPRWRSA
jgi:hypothetical protein